MGSLSPELSNDVFGSRISPVVWADSRGGGAASAGMVEKYSIMARVKQAAFDDSKSDVLTCSESDVLGYVLCSNCVLERTLGRGLQDKRMASIMLLQ